MIKCCLCKKEKKLFVKGCDCKAFVCAICLGDLLDNKRIILRNPIKCPQCLTDFRFFKVNYINHNSSLSKHPLIAFIFSQISKKLLIQEFIHFIAEF